MELWPRVENQVAPALDARMQDRTKNLQKFLDDRAEREVANVTAVIQELERSIRETLADKEDPQLKLEWSDGESNSATVTLTASARGFSICRLNLRVKSSICAVVIADPQPRLFPRCGHVPCAASGGCRAAAGGSR